MIRVRFARMMSRVPDDDPPHEHDTRPVEYHDCTECEATDEDGKSYPGLVVDDECQSCGLKF